MSLLVRLFVTLLTLSWGMGSTTSIAESTRVQLASAAKGEKSLSANGWDFLVERLLADGISDQEIERVFLHKDFLPFTPIDFQLKPAESKNIYRGFYAEKKVSRARQFLDEHNETLKGMEQQYKVSRSLVAAILLVETHFGEFLGKELVVYRLSRLAGLADPKNLENNYRRLLKDGEKITREDVQARADYLFELFYPEVLAAFELERKHGIDLLSLRGSRAGAFGIPQFLPTTFFRFAADGNGDGKVSLFQMEDAIYSVGSFFAGYGWNDKYSDQEKRKVIWHYNRSEPYVETILSLSKQLSQKRSFIPRQ